MPVTRKTCIYGKAPWPPLLRRAILAALLMAISCLTAAADTLIYNTNGPPAPINIPHIWVSNHVAAPFTTGTNAGTVDSVTLMTRTFGNPTGSLAMAIYSGDLGTNLSLVGQLSDSPVPAGTNFVSFTAVSPIPLAPNTRYWAIASSTASDSTNSYGWLWNVSTAYISPVGWHGFPLTGESSDLVHWTTFSLELGFPNTGPIFAIQGTVIPEPSPALLFAFFGTAMTLGWVSRKERLDEPTS